MKKTVSLLLTAALLVLSVNAGAQKLPDATYDNIPRWRGFNLLEKFQSEPDEFSEQSPVWSYYDEPFREEDFEIIRI